MIFNLGRETASGWTRHHRREILPGICDSRAQKCPSYRPTNSSQVVKLTFFMLSSSYPFFHMTITRDIK
jgi:hypothetical protein